MFHAKEIFASEETFEERLSICKNCEKYINLSNQCRVCLCFMPVKARFAAAECPVKKWDRVHPNLDK